MSSIDAAVLSLFCRVGTRWCALPAEHVVEIMRPLPIEPVARTAEFVAGVALIRGAAVPVVDTAALIGAAGTTPTRFVSIQVGGRRVALSVDEVLGLRQLPANTLDEMPPLLGASSSTAVTAIGALDHELLVVLNDAHLVPADTWAVLDASRS